MSMFFKHMMSFDIIVKVQRCFDPQMPLCYWVRCSQFHPLICRERSSTGAIDSPVNYYSSAWIFIPPNRTILNETQMCHEASWSKGNIVFKASTPSSNLLWIPTVSCLNLEYHPRLETYLTEFINRRAFAFLSMPILSSLDQPWW